jgi:excisionase family DNA binding protein
MPASKYKIERKCKVCGKPFFAKTVSSWYCSKNCTCAAYRIKKREEKKEQQRKEQAAKIPESRPYISVPEAVALFGVSRDSLYRLIRKGTIPAINIGERLTRISRAHLESMFPLVGASPVQTEQPKQVNYKFDESDCYTVGQITDLYGVCESTVYKAIRKMSIPTCQRGNYVYVPKVEIDKLFKSVNA